MKVSESEEGGNEGMAGSVMQPRASSSVVPLSDNSDGGDDSGWVRDKEEAGDGEDVEPSFSSSTTYGEYEEASS